MSQTPKPELGCNFFGGRAHYPGLHLCMLPDAPSSTAGVPACAKGLTQDLSQPAFLHCWDGAGPGALLEAPKTLAELLPEPWAFDSRGSTQVVGTGRNV